MCKEQMTTGPFIYDSAKASGLTTSLLWYIQQTSNICLNYTTFLLSREEDEVVLRDIRKYEITLQ